MAYEVYQIAKSEVMGKVAVEIPGYELESLIGHGGMAEVYVARQISLGRKVALKILLQTLSPDASFSSRFEREARTAAALRHPNIIKIYDTGIYEGRYYIAMEYLGSRTLRDLINEGIPPSLAVKYLVKLANALDYAHTKGVIHRDIKPTNILLYQDNEPVLSDFGISRMVEGNSALTATGMMIGSPRYMSQEQARGATVDSRSDLYALGVVFYEMLTGTVPYETENTLALMYMHVNDAIPRLPPELSRYQPVIDGLMAKKPDERPATAGEISQLLDGKLDLTSQFSEIDKTLLVSPETGNTFASQHSVVHTPGSTDSGIPKIPPYPTGSHPGSHSASIDESMPNANHVPPAQTNTRKSRPYGKHILLSVILIVVAGLYWFLAPPIVTSSPTLLDESLDDSMEDIVKQLEDKVNAGDFEAARVLLELGLSRDALDQRLSAYIEPVRTGIKQQNVVEPVDKAGNRVEQEVVLAPEVAKRNNRLATLKGDLDQSLDKEETDQARKTLELLKLENPEASVISRYESLIAVKEQELETRDLFDEHFRLAKSSYEQGHLMEGLAAIEQALSVNPKDTEAQSLQQEIQLEREQKIADLKQKILDALVINDLPEAKNTLDGLKELGAGITEIETHIANLERSQTDNMPPLTMQPSPMNAKLPILNTIPTDHHDVEPLVLNLVPAVQPDRMIQTLNIGPADRPYTSSQTLNLVPANQPDRRSQTLNLIPVDQPDTRTQILNIGPADSPGVNLKPGNYKWNEAESW